MEIFHCQPCDRWLLECSNCKWSLDAPLRPPWVPSGSILLSPSLRGDGADSEASRSVSRVSNMRIHEPWLGSSQMAAMVILVVIKPSKLPFLWPPKKNMAKRIKNGGVRWSRITTTTWKTSCDPSDESSKVGGLWWQPKKKTHNVRHLREWRLEDSHISARETSPNPGNKTSPRHKKKDGFWGVFRGTGKNLK